MLVQKQFQDIFTFTRASGGGRINASGQFEWVAANQPRFDYEPADIPILGPELVTNGDFSGGTTGWSAAYQSVLSNVGGKLRVTANGGTNPYARQIVAVTPGKTYRVTADPGISNNGNGSWNFYLGNTTTTYSAEYKNQSAGNALDVTLIATTSVLNVSFSGGTVPVGDYADFDNVSVKEITGYSARKGDPKGILIEEQRTNFWVTSSDPVSVVGGTSGSSALPSPISSVNYSTFTEDTANTIKQLEFYKAGLTSGQTYAFSIDVKPDTITSIDVWNFTSGILGSVNLLTGASTNPNVKTEKNSDGSYRVTWTVVCASSAVNFRIYLNSGNALLGTGRRFYYANMQLEPGNFSTSRMPTTTAQVTRAADNLSINVLSPWFAATEGSVAITFDTIAAVQPGIYPGLFTFEGASAADRIGAIMTPAQAINALRRKSGSADSYAGTTATVSPNSQIKFAQAWNSASQVSALNGAAASGTILWDGIPAGLSKMLIGRFDATLNGHIRKICYFPKRLTDAQLQALTA